MKNKFNLFQILALTLALVTWSCEEEELQNVLYGQVCPSGVKAPKNIGSKMLVTPDTLRDQLFHSNTSILLGLNKVHQAKAEINVARANLYPSLNLGALLFSAGKPTFTASAVEVLLPFLVPSKWVDYDQSKDQFLSQMHALKAIRLNSYASAYSVYQMILSDLKLYRILQDEIKDLEDIQNTVHKLYLAGLTSKSDFDKATGYTQMAKAGISKVEGIIAKEQSGLRHAMGLDSDVQFTWQEAAVSSSPYESAPVKQVVSQALKLSPEMSQINAMYKAAQEEVFSNEYAFIGGGSIQSPSLTSGNSSVAFDNVNIGLNFNIGYAQVAMVELSEERAKEIEIRKQEIKYELADRSEYSQKLVQEAINRQELSLSAEKAFKSVYERELIKYKYGYLDVLTLLQSRSKYREATIEVLKAKTELDLSRIVLHRLLLSDEFSEIKNCY